MRSIKIIVRMVSIPSTIKITSGYSCIFLRMDKGGIEYSKIYKLNTGSKDLKRLLSETYLEDSETR